MKPARKATVTYPAALTSCHARTRQFHDVQIEPRLAEAPVPRVAVGRLEVTARIRPGCVPEAATQIGDNRQCRPQLSDFTNKLRVCGD